jgi:membrane-bound lytic murein transglycosylase C
MKILQILLFSNLFLRVVYASTMENEMAAMKAEFAAYKQKQTNDFEAYRKALDTEYTAYKKELQVYWKDPKLSTRTEWVSYDKEKKTRSDVDFEKKTITVETIASSKQEAEKNLIKSLAYAVGSDTKKVVQTDPLQKKIAKLPEAPKVVSSQIDARPILSNVIFKKPPTKKELISYTKKVVQKKKIITKQSKLPNQKIYKITIALPKDTTLKRSRVYLNDVQKNAKRFDLPLPLIFAIMQTESNFNPFAKSHIPAFGLMQIVPKSAGVDAYKFLKKKKRMPSASYLYNGSNNIEMGTAYLHILYYRYLKKIENPRSRMYCTIAAYNTGAGNIAWAFTRKMNMNQAAPKINALTPDEVYNRLLTDLKYDEPKHYLKQVNKRMSAFHRVYDVATLIRTQKLINSELK